MIVDNVKDKNPVASHPLIQIAQACQLDLGILIMESHKNKKPVPEMTPLWLATHFGHKKIANYIKQACERAGQDCEAKIMSQDYFSNLKLYGPNV